MASKMEGKMYPVDMTSKTINAEEKKAKRLKLSQEVDGASPAESIPAEPKLDELSSLCGFKVKKVLFEDVKTKTIFVEACREDSEKRTVLILEKEPFGESIAKILSDETSLVKNFNNDIYSKYHAFPKAEVNGIQTTIIHPATDKHVEKYAYHPQSTVRETAEVYEKIVKPYLESQQFSLKWVYNILNHQNESERIIFEDPDPETGFVLLPDLKWNQTDISALYAIAICNQKNIKSLRDLDGSHIPLLKNIFDKSMDALMKKYKLPMSSLRAYLHYQPSYYHLHVHFTNVNYEAPGISAERAHLLDNVIDNLEQYPNYYKERLLVYNVKENDPLYAKLKEADVIC